MSIALPHLLHLIGNLTSPTRFDSTVNVIGGGNIFGQSNLLFAQLFLVSHPLASDFARGWHKALQRPANR